jgi:hypothetical protein
LLIDRATEIRLRAERRAGELLPDLEKNKGAVPGKTGRKGKPVLDPTPRLSDLNINKSQSSRWQKLAEKTDDEFEELVMRAQQKACASIDQPKAVPKTRRKRRPAKLGADCYETPARAVEPEEYAEQTLEERWQNSLANLCGDIISHRAYWRKHFPGWERFDCPSHIKKLVKEATTELASIAATAAPTKNGDMSEAMDLKSAKVAASPWEDLDIPEPLRRIPKTEIPA